MPFSKRIGPVTRTSFSRCCRSHRLRALSSLWYIPNLMALTALIYLIHVLPSWSSLSCLRSCKCHCQLTFRQDCGAGTQISDSSSRHLNILTPAPERFGSLKTKNHYIICTTCLPHKFCQWNRNPNLRLRLSTALLYGIVFYISVSGIFSVSYHTPSSRDYKIPLRFTLPFE